MKSNAWLSEAKTFLVIVLFFAVVGVYLGVRETERVLSTPLSKLAEEQHFDCAVVLTGGAGRVRQGLQLALKGQVQKLLISGVHPQTRFEDLVKPEEVLQGLDQSRVILEHRSQTTYGNAHQSAPLLEAFGCRKVLLITSQAHMYRAMKTFEGALDPKIVLTPHAIPSSKVEEEFWGLMTEVLKSSFYSFWAYPQS